MQYRDYSLRLNLKSLDENSGRFDGICATYGGPPDLVGDILEPGCFRKSIANQPANGYPLLWSHRQDEPIGTARISDSAGALLLAGSLLMADLTAQKAYMHLKAGSVKGISFGFTLPPESSGKVTYGSDGTRRISELFLMECSLVAVPANPLAQVVSVKNLGQVERLLHGIKPGDVSDDAALAAQLRNIDAALKTLLRKDALCECDCPECEDGDCADCSNPNCVDPNCEGSMKARQQAEDLKLLKAFAMELKGITG